MGKRPEDLNLTDQPIETTTPTTERDVMRMLDRIAEMRGSGLFNWADDTLRGIEDSVAGSGRVTEGQRQAVANIEEASWSGRGRRRYEGFRGRSR